MPRGALVGGVPTVAVDVPISAVFVALYLGGAVCHMTLFRRNLAKGHKFLPSGVTFGFCMSRIVTMCLRIAWACHPHNIPLGLASNIFAYVGVVLLFVLNLIFAQRMLRASYPRIGWSRPASLFVKGLVAILIMTIIMLVTVMVISFYTLNPHTLHVVHDIQLYAVTFCAFLAFVPLPVALFCLLFPRPNTQLDVFGKGSWYGKGMIIVVAAFLLCLGASFRAGTVYDPIRPRNDPAWYDSRAAFYLFNFTVEIIVVYLFLFGRTDQRFHVPNGSSKVRHYGGAQISTKGQQDDSGFAVETLATSTHEADSGVGSLSEVPISHEKQESMDRTHL